MNRFNFAALTGFVVPNQSRNIDIDLVSQVREAPTEAAARLAAKELIVKAVASATNEATAGFLIGILINIGIAIGIAAFTGGAIDKIIYASASVSFILLAVFVLLTGAKVNGPAFVIIFVIRTIELTLMALAMFFLADLLFNTAGRSDVALMGSKFTMFAITALGAILLSFFHSLYQTQEQAKA